MWTALALVVLAASPAGITPVPEVTAGTKLRISAGKAVDVPGLYSGTESRHVTTRPFERRGGLLVFAGENGHDEALVAPGATVTGTFVGADPTHLFVRLRDGRAPARIRRESVSRVQAFLGAKRQASKGATIGGITGAVLFFGFYQAATREGTDWPPSLEGAMVTTAVGGGAGLGVGAGLGALFQSEDWREVPLEALPGRSVAARRAHADPPGPRTALAGESWRLLVLDRAPGLTFGLDLDPKPPEEKKRQR